MKLFAIILAAGGSSRLGRPKQLVEWNGERLLDRAVRIAREAGCEPVVVLGASANRIEMECDLNGCVLLRNAAWAEGLASSIRNGVQYVIDHNGEAALLMTCDQPAVSVRHLRELLARGMSDPVACSYAGRKGIPAWFPARSFAALTELSGDIGARDLLREADSVELAGGELDIDTEESLAEARRWAEASDSAK